MLFLGKKSLGPLQEIFPSGQTGVGEAETVLAAAKRVHERFGVKTEASKLAGAIAVAKNLDHTATAFAAANIGVLNSANVLTYQAKRTRPTWRERLKSWNQTVYDYLEKFFMHGGSGQISALVSMFVTVPLIICLVLDTYWYEVDYFWSFVTINLSQIMLLLGMGPDPDMKEEFFDQFTITVGRFYSSIHMYGIVLPFWALVVLVGFPFHPASGVQKWKTVKLNNFKEQISNEVALKVDQIVTALPEAKLELQVLQPKVGDKSEFFLTSPLGDTGERLYLWHEAA